ncbi:MAG: site-2 protease family protein [Clostridia bacterium]|nr:site-2 protease family protein [Clostridia bacterium]
MLTNIFSHLSEYLITVPAVLLALIFHEVSHGYMAYKLGDPTARNVGRLSLNPLVHLDLFGTLCMIFFHFGWAKPVPVNSRYFKNPKRDMALTALAGPLTNLLLAFFAVPFYSLLLNAYAGQPGSFVGVLCFYSALFFYYFHLVNIGLAVFNLIPLPPLDGSRLLLVFLPPKTYFELMRYERYIQIGLIIFLLLGYRLGILSLLSSFLSGGMEAVWRVIPLFR